MKLNLVPARTGVEWVKLGIRTFWQQPLALTGLFFMYMAAVALLSAVPWVGLVLMLAITPAATLGLMVATQEATKGRFPMPAVLVSAFKAGRQRLRSMMQLGFIYAAGSLLVNAVATLILGQPPASSPGNQVDKGMLLLLALHFPLAVAFWFAPALVHWHGVTPAKSLFFSVVAVWRNFSAFTVYGLLWTLVIAAILMVATLVIAMLGAPQIAPAILMPVVLTLAAMFFTSIYFTFIDSFTAEVPAQASPATTTPPPPDPTP